MAVQLPTNEGTVIWVVVDEKHEHRSPSRRPLRSSSTTDRHYHSRPSTGSVHGGSSAAPLGSPFRNRVARTQALYRCPTGWSLRLQLIVGHREIWHMPCWRKAFMADFKTGDTVRHRFNAD